MHAFACAFECICVYCVYWIVNVFMRMCLFWMGVSVHLFVRVSVFV